MTLYLLQEKEKFTESGSVINQVKNMTYWQLSLLLCASVSATSDII